MSTRFRSKLARAVLGLALFLALVIASLALGARYARTRARPGTLLERTGAGLSDFTPVEPGAATLRVFEDRIETGRGSLPLGEVDLPEALDAWASGRRFRHGQLVSLESPKGDDIYFTYDAEGHVVHLEMRDVTKDGTSFEISWHAAGVLDDGEPRRQAWIARLKTGPIQTRLELPSSCSDRPRPAAPGAHRRLPRRATRSSRPSSRRLSRATTWTFARSRSARSAQ